MLDILERNVAKQSNIHEEKCYIRDYFVPLDDFFQHNIMNVTNHRKMLETYVTYYEKYCYMRNIFVP
jgi:hypothetical protein